MSQLEVSTEVESEVGHHQFTIRSLVILTAAVAVFFALATQVEFYYAMGYVHLAFLILALSYRTRWKGISAINYAFANLYFLPAIVANFIQSFSLVFFLMQILVCGSIFSGIFLLFNSNRFNKISGGMVLAIYPLAILILVFVVRLIIH